MGAYVYMLRCADGSYYVGSATGNDLTRRMQEHETGAYRGYTSKRRPVQHGCDCGRAADQGLDAREERSTDTRRLERAAGAGAA